MEQHQETSQSQYSLFPKKPKFLRRFVVLDVHDEPILQKARQKGIYVRCMTDLDMSKHVGKINLKKHKYIKGKTVNCLKKVEITNSGKYEWYNVLKYAKNIESFDLVFIRSEIFESSGFAVQHKKSTAKLLQCLKKLPKGIKNLSLKIFPSLLYT